MDGWLKIFKIKKPYLMSLIMKQTTLAHELFCDITIYLTDTNLPGTIFLDADISKGAANTIFTPLVWCGGGIRTHNLPLRKRRSTN